MSLGNRLNCHPAMEERIIDVIERLAGRNEINVLTRVAIPEVLQRNRPATLAGCGSVGNFNNINI